MVSWGCRRGHSNLWYPGVTEEGVVGPIEQRRMGTCLVWEFGRSCIGSTIYTLPSNPRIPQSCSMYMCNIIIVKLTLVLCYTCTHPHTHTPTHLHTHTPSHPHTLTPTHPHTHSGITVSGAYAVARHLCRLVPGTTLYGRTNLEKAEVPTISLFV